MERNTLETHCRAKDPSTCRVHGSSGRSLPISKITDNAHLSEIADNAKISGDFELFVNAKAQMDKNTREAAFVAPVPEKVEITQNAGNAAAAARWRAAQGLFAKKWEYVDADIRYARVNREKEDLAKALPHMPDGEITDEAVEAMTQASAGSIWYRLDPHRQNEIRKESRAALEAAAPHLGISVNTRASIRSIFRNVEGTIQAGVEEISEHHEQPIPAEIGGNTVAWADMNPFKSPFKNGKLR